MFDNLTHHLAQSFKTIQGKNKFSAANIKTVIEQVRIALLEADVAQGVIEVFLRKVEEKAIGLVVAKELNPQQAFVQLVQSELSEIIGGENQALNLKTQAPAVILIAGLQGVGKTTSIAKLALYLKQREGKKVLVVSADVYRPAAIEQLEILANQAAVEFFPSSSKDKPANIVIKAKKYAQQQFFDVLLIDTAGRLHIDKDMMNEIKTLQKKVNPIETLFVVDAMMGQDAARVAKVFADTLTLSGIILSKIDGDAKGGSALSVRYITGKPIKFMGVGEKIGDFEPFHPERIVSRLLGHGDVLSLIEEISRKTDNKKAQKSAKKITKGQFDLTDMRDQLQQMQQMGGVQAMIDKLPNMRNLPEAAKTKMLNDKQLVQMIAIINSMTVKERTHTKLIKGSRKIRISNGAGTDVQSVNKLLKQFEKMQKQMRKMSGSKIKKMMAKMG